MNDEDIERKFELLIKQQDEVIRLLSKQQAIVAALTAACSTLIAASPVRKEAARLLRVSGDQQRGLLIETEAIAAFEQTMEAILKWADRPSDLPPQA